MIYIYTCQLYAIKVFATANYSLPLAEFLRITLSECFVEKKLSKGCI